MKGGLHFCTYFNSSYLGRGLVLYHSLLKHCPSAHLYVIAFDDACFEYLEKLGLQSMTVIPLRDFEDEELLRVKPGRSTTEYCWTCTPSTVLYCLNTFDIESCTYMDADMCFYSDPSVLVAEMKTASVLITEHRYTKEYDQSATSGKYCVQFMTFLKDEAGLKALRWWRNACIEWCYARHEDGKFGDQKYLDDWTTRFEGIHVLQHPGGGLAPWNVNQYNFKKESGTLTGTERSSGKKFDVVFFHFHSLRFFDDDIVQICDTGYEISDEVIGLFYKPYVRDLGKVKREAIAEGARFDPNGSAGKAPYREMSLSTAFRHYRESIRNSRRNIFGRTLGKRIRQHYFFRASEF
jgi:hypothetical protein